MAEIGCCTKYFLFFFNILFWSVGLLLLGIGIWAWSEKGFFDNISIISSLPIDPVLVVIIIAIIMFILSFAGCIGSLRENLTLLKFFSVCLGIIFFAELIAGILGFVYKDWFFTQFAVFVNSTISEYREDPDLQNIIDFSQEFLQCCGGARGPPDWDNNVYFKCNSEIEVNGIMYTPMESCGVPFSCCKRENLEVVNTQCGFGVRDPEVTATEQAERINTIGCITSFEDWLKINLYTVAGIFIGVALLQIIPICFAQNLMSDIKAVKARCLRYSRSLWDVDIEQVNQPRESYVMEPLSSNQIAVYEAEYRNSRPRDRVSLKNSRVANLPEADVPLKTKSSFGDLE